MKRLFFLLIMLSAPWLMAADKSVLVAILARNKAHVLPRYLQCLSKQEYPKKLMSIYIKTDNNSDATREILEQWAQENKEHYKEIIFDDEAPAAQITERDPHAWTPFRFKTLAEIRNKSMQKALERGSDYYLVVDCDNFIAPCTISDLVAKDKPIIAPLLRNIPEPNDLYSNFFYSCEPNGYYKDHPNHIPILKRALVGTFKVDLVHCTYLINSKYINQLNYIDGTDDYEFIIFARIARKNGVDQYITNEKEYGVQVHFNNNVTLEEEKSRLEAILTLP